MNKCIHDQAMGSRRFFNLIQGMSSYVLLRVNGIFEL